MGVYYFIFIVFCLCTLRCVSNMERRYPSNPEPVGENAGGKRKVAYDGIHLEDV